MEVAYLKHKAIMDFAKANISKNINIATAMEDALTKSLHIFRGITPTVDKQEEFVETDVVNIDSTKTKKVLECIRPIYVPGFINSFFLPELKFTLGFNKIKSSVGLHSLITKNIFYLFWSQTKVILTRLHFLSNLLFFVYNPMPKSYLIKPLKATKYNFLAMRLHRILKSHKQLNIILPDIKWRQMRGFFSFHKRQRIKLKKNKKVKIFKLSSSFNSRIVLKTPALKRRTGRTFMVNYRKQFKNWKRLYFKRVTTSFYLGKVRPVQVKRMLGRFVGKNMLALSYIFALNPIRLVTRAFPFFNRFFIKSLLKEGFIYANFKQLQFKFGTLKVGDFVHILWSKTFYKFYRVWIRRQRRYYYRVNKNMYHYYKARKKKSLGRHKNYMRKFTWYTNLHKPTPQWLELSYLSLSFFIIKAPTKLTFSSYNFNPYLNRLLAF